MIQGGSIANRLMNALGASELVRTICATAGITGVVATQGLSPEVDPEEWPHARYLLVWGWNPMSTAPHLWKKLLEARQNGAKLVVVDPFRSRTANVADLHLTAAARDRRGARARDDARGRSTPASPTRSGAARTRSATTTSSSGSASTTSSTGRRSAGSTAETIAEVAREFATTQPALLRLGVGAQRHLGAPVAYRTVACLPALVGAWRHRGGGCSYIPTATAGAVAERRPRRRRAAYRRRAAADQHVAGRRGAHRRDARPGGSARSSSGRRTRPRSRPTRSGCSRACAARTCTRS